MLNDHIRDKTFEVRLGRKNKEDCCVEPNCGPAENICQPDYQPGTGPFIYGSFFGAKLWFFRPQKEIHST